MLKKTLPASVALALLTQFAGGDGPIVPGVKQCTFETPVGTWVIECDWSETCCAAPVYAPCPFPPGGSCIAELPYACCDPLEDCWYQQRGGKIYVWCGGPFPPE